MTWGRPRASHVELLATEFNSVYSNPGKQTTSLVNGLFVADSLGSLLETRLQRRRRLGPAELLRQQQQQLVEPLRLAAGRRLRHPRQLRERLGPRQRDLHVPYPTYFAEQLASKIVQAERPASCRPASSDQDLSTYAVLEPNGHLDLLVINKNPDRRPDRAVPALGVHCLPPRRQTWQYGEAQDTAQSETTDRPLGPGQLRDDPDRHERVELQRTPSPPTR